MRQLSFPAFALLAALLVAAPCTAAEDEEPRGRMKSDSGRSSAADAPDPAAMERVVTDTGVYVFALTLPLHGGAYHSEADMGIDPAADPLDYPLIWTNEGALPLYEMLMVGILEQGAPIDEAGFASLLAEEHAGLLAEFPRNTTLDEALDLAGGSAYPWVYSSYVTKDGTATLARFNMYCGNRYYSIVVFSPLIEGNEETLWPQLTDLVGSFEVLDSAGSPAG